MEPSSRDRVVVVIGPGDELGPALVAAQQVAPGANELHVVVLLEAGDEPHRETLRRGREALEAELARWPQAPAAARSVTTSFELAFDTQRVQGALVVVGPWRARKARDRVLAMLELSSRAQLVVSVGARAPAAPGEFRGPHTVAIAFEGPSSLHDLAAAARALPHVGRVVGLALGADEARRDELETTLRALLPAVDVELELLPAAPIDAAQFVERAAERLGASLVIVPREGPDVVVAVTGLLAAQALQDAGRPYLIVRSAPARGQRLVASDSLWLPGVPVRVTLELVGALGRVPVGDGARVELPGRPGPAPLTVVEGVVEVPPTWFTGWERLHPLALSLLDGEAELAGREPSGHAGLAVSHAVGTARPMVLVDAHLPRERFGDLERLAADFEIVFVRLRSDDALHELRERRLAALPWGGPALVLDAHAWLDDGGAGDVPRAVDPVRLVRLGLRLRALGARVAAVVTSEAQAPRARDVRVLTPEGLARQVPGALAEAPPRRDVLELLTGAAPVEGNHVHLELDNAAARRALLEAARTARERLHLQSYIFEDDDVVREVCDALAAAAARGVAVRVLADALYSLHGAYGTTNVVLARLAAAGVEVRAWQPLSGVPSLESLKQRNHRKLLVVDGECAWLSGRNLGAVYYRGFDEVQLTRRSSFAEVPWFDCGVRVEGPVVAQVERAFLADWERAGGAPFPVPTPPPAGRQVCRLVLHDGLIDAYTLDLQRLLIERATQRLLLVSTFPLVVELQRALVHALRRGVRVQVLFGNVRPRRGDGTPFEGGVYRELGDELVRARLEPVLRAGAEGYELALPPRPGWSPDLDRVFTHVHAKLIVRDDVEVAVGSANVDVTSAYWESEAVLLVHDEGFARETLAALEPLLESARRVDLRGPDWEPMRVRREWLGRHWPTLVG